MLAWAPLIIDGFSAYFFAFHGGPDFPFHERIHQQCEKEYAEERLDANDAFEVLGRYLVKGLEVVMPQLDEGLTKLVGFQHLHQGLVFVVGDKWENAVCFRIVA